jgi:hypothetical protein
MNKQFHIEKVLKVKYKPYKHVSKLKSVKGKHIPVTGHGGP